MKLEIVKLSKPIDTREADLRFVLLERNESRSRVEAIMDWQIRPQFVYNNSDLVKAESQISPCPFVDKALGR